MKRKIKRRPLPEPGPIEVGMTVVIATEPRGPGHLSLHKRGDLATVKEIQQITAAYVHVRVWLHKWLSDPELLRTTAGPFYLNELRPLPSVPNPIRRVTLSRRRRTSDAK